MSRTGEDSLRPAFRALAAGRAEALAEVWRALSRPLHHYAFVLTGDRDEADDLLGETMARLPRQGWRLRWVRNPKAYLFAAVRNAARSRARRSRRPDPGSEGRPARLDETEKTLVRAAVRELPEEQREVVVLHIWGGLTFEEIGRTTGVPANTAASRYRYALGKLRQAFGED
jgi:RNA polymerase sigma-70 factor (ECF subfamily)